MKERVMYWCGEGENCSRAILRAAAEKYGFPYTGELENCCAAVSTGFGIGTFCSGLIACIMVLGMLFDPEEAKAKRLALLMTFKEKYGSLDCGALSGDRADCIALMGEMGSILEDCIGTVQETAD
ncbi:C_GCAxxG_C_C family protein [Anaerotignum lactatifermentans]|uniref:C_GCAxxG_C_C family protein n=1 Tax=Anaerotignum lactatifermentans TaxID=160404 RepID=A0ABS2GB25_9FIRM|nr:C-GCAxxG-C-C family protein [Anaerotignum lactatifermentans]MBM6830164.1 C_GCAxxG_C_C family protein [Anaerotignum lactatifermentans]MBM6878691.1 C_GCAxxG_C_C family protein [Anaerotignum lactatifermentans]MBM6951777.1 C_GCAxxG_C_C family protein [Anaerotignum lactatifermentans]